MNEKFPLEISGNNFLTKIKRFKIIGIIFAILLFLFLSFSGFIYFYQQKFNARVYPGVMLGNYDLGGMNKEELIDFTESLNNRLVKEDLNYYLLENDKQQDFKVETILAMGEDSLSLINFNSEEFAQKALSVGREDLNWKRFINPLFFVFKNKQLQFDLKIDKDNFRKNLHDVLDGVEDKANSADIKISSLSPLTYEIIPEKTGRIFDYDKIIQDTEDNLKVLDLSAIKIEKYLFLPQVLQSDLVDVKDKIQEVIDCGDLSFTYEAPPGSRDKFTIKIVEISDWLSARKNEEGDIYFSLNDEKLDVYLKSVKEIIDIPVQNPKFTLVNGKVKEFREPEDGLGLNIEQTKKNLEEYFQKGACNRSVTNTLNLVVEKTKTEINLGDINDMGVNKLIGTGFSTFLDSHNNRIKNIARAVELLNGVLIPPGETFSAVKYAGPFTLENGFLPEEIIKGDKIIKEVGGGMCQIGTTLFRMAMNAGMDITERHNHSLVVSYYADPVNKNPGTDAALYDPFLDLKFVNDTGGYLLLQTKIDYKKQMLSFSLWGRDDGRSGSYTHPLVSKWIPAGEPKEVVSPELKPGEVKCQNAFRGAISSFVYTRFTSTSEKIERTFTSVYRALPKLCLVGPSEVASSTLPLEEGVSAEVEEPVLVEETVVEIIPEGSL